MSNDIEPFEIDEPSPRELAICQMDGLVETLDGLLHGLAELDLRLGGFSKTWDAGLRYDFPVMTAAFEQLRATCIEGRPEDDIV